MYTSLLPIFSLTGVTFAVLAILLLAMALRAVLYRRLDCPADGRRADVTFEVRKRTPWGQPFQIRALACSLRPDGVDCPQQCTACLRSTAKL